jgi:hypothetical protein
MMAEILILLGLLSIVLLRPTSVEIRRRELQHGYDVFGSALLAAPGNPGREPSGPHRRPAGTAGPSAA